MSVWPQPELSEIGTLWPSSANRLIGCGYAFALSRDPGLKALRKPSVQSALGSAAHKVSEDVTCKLLPEGTEARAWLDTLWDEAIAEQLALLKAAWADSEVPDPDTWRGYTYNKVRLLKKLRPQVRTIPPEAAKGAVAGLDAVRYPAVERQFDAPALKLSGRPDRVELGVAGLRVVDLKSGLNQGEPTAAQTRQLALYGAVVSDATGEEVVSLEIENTAGARWAVPDPVDAIAKALVEVGEARDRYERVRTRGADASTLASPALDRCRWCDFRVVCEPFWAARLPEWPTTGLVGRVVEMDAEADSLKLEVLRPTELASQHVNLALRGRSVDANIGGILAVADTDVLGGATSQGLRWNSSLIILEP